jgi:tetratricopeptide (TPR) repeat protein
VTTPLYFSSSKLYTYDFLEAVRRRLTPDGVYVTWVDSRVGDRGIDIILKTLRQSFKSCWLGAIKSTYLVLACSQEPIALRQPRLISDNPVLADYFFAKNALRPEWFPYGLLSTRALTLAGDPDAPVNTLDYPALEFEMARLGSRGIGAFKRRLLDDMNLAEMATALSAIGFNPLHLAVHAELLLGDSTITDRWKGLASRRVDGFDAHYRQLKLAHYASYAAAAGSAVAYRKYGNALLSEERYPESIEQFRTALRIDPNTNNAYFNIGAAYEKNGQFEAALENYTNELKVDPTDEDVDYRRGRVSYKLARYEQALKFLQSAARQQDAADIQFYLGRTLEAFGQFTGAKAAYQRALALDGDHAEARRALELNGLTLTRFNIANQK